MDLIRCFLAIDPGERLRARLAALQGLLAAHFPFPVLRWIAPSDYHLTLVFLGQVRVREIERIHDCVARIGVKLPPLHYRLVSARPFPDGRRPRVIAALPEDTRPFQRWQEPLADALGEAGFAVERRPYRAHLSLGRWKSRTACAQRDEFALDLEGMADAVTLYESRGGHYFPLFAERCGQGSAR